MAQYIREQTGVTLNVVLYSTEKAQAMAASGDLYDLNRMDAQYITPLIQAGAVQSLDEYLDYAPGLTENFPEMINYSREYMSAGEDQMYAVFARGKSEPPRWPPPATGILSAGSGIRRREARRSIPLMIFWSF